MSVCTILSAGLSVLASTFLCVGSFLLTPPLGDLITSALSILLLSLLLRSSSLSSSSKLSWSRSYPSAFLFPRPPLPTTLLGLRSIIALEAARRLATLIRLSAFFALPRSLKVYSTETPLVPVVPVVALPPLDPSLDGPVRRGGSACCVSD